MNGLKLKNNYKMRIYIEFKNKICSSKIQHPSTEYDGRSIRKLHSIKNKIKNKSEFAQKKNLTSGFVKPFVRSHKSERATKRCISRGKTTKSSVNYLFDKLEFIYVVQFLQVIAY